MKTKKILASLVLAIVAFTLVFTSFPVVSNAAATTGEVSFKFTENDKLSTRTIAVYKVFNAVGTEEKPAYNLDGLDDVLAFFKTLGTEEKAINNELDAIAYFDGINNESDALSQFAEKFYAYATDENHIISEAGTTKNGELKVNTGAGYYIIYDISGAVVEGKVVPGTSKAVATVGTIFAKAEGVNEVALKVKDVTVDKDAKKDGKDVDNGSVKVGDVIDYTITLDVPDMRGFDTYTVRITDTMSEGLTLDQDSVVIKIDNVDYKIKESVDAKLLSANSIDIRIADIKAASKDGTKAVVVVTYKAVVNEKAFKGAENKNTVIAEYSRDPQTGETGITNPDETNSYTYNVELTKTDAKGNVITEEASFYLKKGEKYVKETESAIELVDDEASATLFKTVDGKLNFKGLDEGKYTLVEKSAPKGYAKPTFDFTFEITLTKVEGKVTGAKLIGSDASNKEYVTGSEATGEDYTLEISVKNAKEGALPTTGGMGTVIFTVAGIVLMAGAAVVLVVRNRKED